MARRAEIGGAAAFLLCAAECGSETERRHRAEGKVRGVTACGPPEGRRGGENVEPTQAAVC